MPTQITFKNPPQAKTQDRRGERRGWSATFRTLPATPPAGGGWWAAAASGTGRRKRRRRGGGRRRGSSRGRRRACGCRASPGMGRRAGPTSLPAARRPPDFWEGSKSTPRLAVCGARAHSALKIGARGTFCARPMLFYTWLF